MNPRRYALFGLSIESPFPLPGAPEADTAVTPPDVTVDISTAGPVAGSSGGTEPEFVTQADGSVAIGWGDALRFIVSPLRDRILVVAPPANLPFAPTVLVGIVMGYVLHLRGTLCLHGAVLARGDRAISLLGSSGAGKSTLTAALVLDGAMLLSDDLTVVRRTAAGVMAERGCGVVRLHGATASRLLGDGAQLSRVPYVDKVAWHLSVSGTAGGSPQFAARPSRLDALYVLESRADGGPVEIGPPLSQREALPRLVGAWYPPRQPALLTADRLADLNTLTREVPVRLVRHAKTWEQLPELVARLIA